MRQFFAELLLQNKIHKIFFYVKEIIKESEELVEPPNPDVSGLGTLAPIHDSKPGVCLVIGSGRDGAGQSVFIANKLINEYDTSHNP